MSAFGRAGALSLGLHVALIAGAYRGLGGPGTPTPAGAPTRGGKVAQDVGVVMMAVPEVGPAPVPPQAAPAVPVPQAVGIERALPEPPPLPKSILGNVPAADVRPAVHSELPPVRPGPASVAHASGSVTTFFSVAAQGKSVVYVIDRSSSIGDERFDRAREQVIASLRQLPPDARFQVIAYDKNALPLRVGEGGLAAATLANVEAAAAALAAMRTEGGTDHVRALRLALSLAPDVVFFLTDEDELTAKDVGEIKRLNHERASIHALCLVAPLAAETPMRDLARQNRGEFRVVGP
jgi:hypothetical protein